MITGKFSTEPKISYLLKNFHPIQISVYIEPKISYLINKINPFQINVSPTNITLTVMTLKTSSVLYVRESLLINQCPILNKDF